jgi:Ser/Thr protein kinase RdoA (MazF antagonist)
MKQFENYAIYIDLVWQNKNNKLAFIMLNKDLRELDSYQESISIFDLKTKTNVLKVYNEIDWKAIELS